MGIVFINRPALRKHNTSLRKRRGIESHEKGQQIDENGIITENHRNQYLIAKDNKIDILEQKGIQTPLNEYLQFLDETSSSNQSSSKYELEDGKINITKQGVIETPMNEYPQFLDETLSSNQSSSTYELEDGKIDITKQVGIETPMNQYPQFLDETSSSNQSLSKYKLENNAGEEKLINPLECSNAKHILIRRESRRRCVKCYSMLTQEYGRKHAQRKTPNVKWYCDQCRKAFCVPCFKNIHLKTDVNLNL
jgi:hypothetical protein